MTTKLPDPGFPMLTRMITEGLFTEKGTPATANAPATPTVQPKDQSLTWVVSEPHPLLPDCKVVRMFVTEDGVMVYAWPSDGKAGMRNLIPNSRIRMVEEVMPPEVFIEELAAAESDDEPDDPTDDEPEDELRPQPVQTSNGQPPVS